MYSPPAPTVYVALDIEHFEGDRQQLLELGIAWVSSTDLRRSCTDPGFIPPMSCRHWINSDRLDVRNGRFCPDNKWQSNFCLSMILPATTLMQELDCQLQALAVLGRVVLVGQALKGDIDACARYGTKLDFETDAQIDLQLAHQAYRVNPTPCSLENILLDFGIPYKHLHNAANDAVYTLQAILTLGLWTMDSKNRGPFGLASSG